MKILYNNNTGRIFYTVYDRDWFAFNHTTNIPLTEFIIDEIDPENKAICIDLVKTVNKLDKDGNPKYYIVEVGGVPELHQTDNWVEYIEPIL